MHRNLWSDTLPATPHVAAWKIARNCVPAAAAAIIFTKLRTATMMNFYPFPC